METRIWFQQEDKQRPGHGDFSNQTSVDGSQFVPPLGAYVETNMAGVGGWVSHIQFMYGRDYLSIYIILSEEKPK